MWFSSILVFPQKRKITKTYLPDVAPQGMWPQRSSTTRTTIQRRISSRQGSFSTFCKFPNFLIFRLTGCAPFYGDSYDDVVEKNLKGDLNYNFEEINLKLEDSTLDLLRNLLKKSPSQRISAQRALEHPCFKNVIEDGFEDF